MPLSVKSKQGGVSLIEVVIALVLIGVVAGYALPNLGLTGRSLIVNEQVQIATQLSQSCAEKILMSRRDEVLYGYPWVDVNSCSSIVAPAGYAITVSIALVTNAVDPVCPVTTTDCKDVTISVFNNGSLRASADLFLPAY